MDDLTMTPQGDEAVVPATTDDAPIVTDEDLETSAVADEAATEAEGTEADPTATE